MEGVCHGAGQIEDDDIGTPTYFRYPIEQSGGQNIHPGSAHAVLYSLQRTTGRSCDFKTYTDTEVSFSKIHHWFFYPKTLKIDKKNFLIGFSSNYRRYGMDRNSFDGS